MVDSLRFHGPGPFTSSSLLLNAAKHKGMKKRSFEFMPKSDLVLNPPAYPYKQNQVFRLLREALDKAERSGEQQLTLKQLGILIGAPRSTIHDWYYGDLPKPIKNFLCALERLFEDQRMILLRKLCRDCPRIEHPRVAHDQQAVNTLNSLITQKVGLTLIRGSSDALRTFLITAMGNSAFASATLRGITGLDLHRPDHFVPVPGVLYFRKPEPGAQIKAFLGLHWSHIEDSAATLVLLNRIWTMMPELRSKIESLARRKHVVVADEFEATPKGLLRVVSSIVTVTAAANRRVTVRVEALDPGR
jgi:hypothetical protein